MWVKGSPHLQAWLQTGWKQDSYMSDQQLLVWTHTKMCTNQEEVLTPI